ncbi:MAG: BadF/BadG/BcrA/BcrD ATPase family protein [Bryobacteraceae bacterium]|jgi:N-acetylglucosamine kinase
MKLFLGVDGGQSGTTAAIGDETGRVLGEGGAGPGNHAAGGEGRAKLERAVRESVGQAAGEAGLDAAALEFESACFGMSGGPEDKRAILSGTVRAARLVVTTDAAVALVGATGSGLGIVVIAGTGSMALGRNRQGRTARAGGWGYVFGDEGGAFDMVRQAARAALRMEEGWGPETALRAALLEATGSASADQLLHRFYTPEWERSRVAALAPLVDRAASEADAVALHIVNQAAQELAQLAAAVRAQLWRPTEVVEMAYSGGVFASRMLLERFRILVEMEAGNRLAPPQHPPHLGALLEAYRAAGLSVELRTGVRAD